MDFQRNINPNHCIHLTSEATYIYVDMELFTYFGVQIIHLFMYVCLGSNTFNQYDQMKTYDGSMCLLINIHKCTVNSD